MMALGLVALTRGTMLVAQASLIRELEVHRVLQEVGLIGFGLVLVAVSFRLGLLVRHLTIPNHLRSFPLIQDNTAVVV